VTEPGWFTVSDGDQFSAKVKDDIDSIEALIADLRVRRRILKRRAESRPAP
jgi:hypothetical protein